MRFKKCLKKLLFLFFQKFDGPAPDRGYCPWNEFNYQPVTFDCPEEQLCSLKFIAKCQNNYFNKGKSFKKNFPTSQTEILYLYLVVPGMCKYQEALSILRHINAMIWELGMQWEQYLGYTCDGGGTYPDIFYRIKGSKMYVQKLFLIKLYFNRYRRKRPKVDASIFDSALSQTRRSDASEKKIRKQRVHFLPNSPVDKFRVLACIALYSHF